MPTGRGLPGNTGLAHKNSNKSTVFDLQIFDNTGKMLSAIFQVTGRKEIDLTGNAAGIYYINIMGNGKFLDTKKIILIK